jgi:preprotein translocase subunit SecF
MQLPIIKYRNVWFAVSTLLVAACVVILMTNPLKFGIDFTGGSLMELEFKGERPTPVQVSEEIAALDLGESVAQTVGEKEMLLRLKTLDEPTHQKVRDTLDEKFGGVTELRFESVGPTVGDELRKKALWSVSLVLLGIALFVAYAFRKVSRPVASWKYGIVTLIVGLLHDVLIPLAAFALLGKYALAEVNSSFVAAILTVLGFSVHDTIVVFDRIRENAARFRDRRFDRVVNQSINETLSRTIWTSATVFFVTLAMNVLGVGVIRDFAFAMNVGVIVGTFSSIFIASPILIWLNDKYVANQRKQQGRQARRPARGDEEPEGL